MQSIRKTLLTPVKWASKALIHKTLLSFPGGETSPTVACVYCPEMCRFSCPTAIVSNNDAVTPSNKMAQLFAKDVWKEPVESELWPVFDCTGCGRCTEYCLHQVPVWERLFEARTRYQTAQAKSVLETLDPERDPVGDLAWELGNARLAEERLKSREKGEFWAREPKSVAFVRHQTDRTEKETPWIADTVFESVKALGTDLWNQDEMQSLKRLRVWDSPWVSRHLKARDTVERWLELGKKAGKVWIQPSHSLYPPTDTADVLDSGLEGAYRWLFPKQATLLLRDVFDQIDASSYDGIWVWSPRAKEGLLDAMKEKVVQQKPILGWWELGV